jgi:hypothetical protein
MAIGGFFPSQNPAYRPSARPQSVSSRDSLRLLHRGEGVVGRGYNFRDIFPATFFLWLTPHIVAQ